jgi:hypothetical protein
VDGSELLQTSHLSEAEHSAFSSSKRQVGILSPIIYPATRFLPIRVANNFHCSAVGGAVRRMGTRIRLLVQPEPMRSIVGAIQQEQRFD